MNIFYNIIFIPVVKLLLPLIKLLLPKFKAREQYIRNTPIAVSLDRSKPTIWFHAASMGEFEQAKPVIEKIYLEKKYNIVCTFYSPSGFENQKHYKFADYICYLPLDTRKNATFFINTIKPDIAVFVRYDLWLNYLTELSKQNIPTILICATKPTTKFLKAYYRKIYQLFDTIISMSKEDTQYFESIAIDSEIITGADTRFDRIIDIVSQAQKAPLIPKSVFADCFVLLAGSCWLPDEKIIAAAVSQFNQVAKRKIQIIYVPHEPTEEHIRKLQQIEPNSICYSTIENIADENELAERLKDKALIIDSIGKLLYFYANADIAYIGGALGVGVHSVTEPAGYGIPLITGTDFSNSPDARILAEKHILKAVSTAQELLDYLLKITSDDIFRANLGKSAQAYIHNSKGASYLTKDIILKSVRE